MIRDFVAQGWRARVLAILSFSLLVGACGNAGGPTNNARSRDAAADTVEAFFAALEQGDAAALERLAPDTPMADAELAVLGELLATWDRAIPDAGVTIDGAKAVVLVELIPRDGGAPVDLRIPLDWRDGSWRLPEQITAEQRLDFIPIE